MKTYKRKVLAVGEDGTGKASLLHTVHTGAFPEPWCYVSSCSGDVREVQLPGNTGKVELSLWTAPGLPKSNKVRPSSYAGSNVILLCYSVDKPESYDVITDLWMPEIRKHTRSGTPVLLVANKTDLRHEQYNKADLSACAVFGRERHYVTSKAGQDLAKRIGAAAFVECSAKDGLNIDELVNYCVEHSLRKEKPPTKKRDILNCVQS